MRDLNIIGAEVCAVLNKVSKERYNKVPIKIREEFEKFKEEAIKVEIKEDIPFEEQDITKEAKNIIFAISLNYWLTEEKKKEVLIKLKENEEALEEKYNANKIFEKMSKEEINVDIENKNIVKEQKEKWYVKILNKIKKWFRI